MFIEYKLLRVATVAGCTLDPLRMPADNQPFASGRRCEAIVRRVVVSFGGQREYALEVDQGDLDAISLEDARAWLAEGFDAAGCEPSNPMGKVLAVDLLLGVARAAGESRFAQPSSWRTRYAAAALRLREEPELMVDLAAYEVRALS